jgi:hypothetical protein
VAGSLVELAERFLRLSTEIEDVRRGMLACLGNGAGDPVPRPPPAERPARPTTARLKPGLHPNAAKAAPIDQRVLR